MYLRLKEEDARDTIGGSLEVKLDSFIAEGAYFHKLNEQYALELGVRYWDFDTTLRPALLPEVSQGNDFVDGLIGFRSKFDVDENWEILFRANVGGGGSGLTEVGLDLSFTGLSIGYTFDL